jgi:uncharacterized protein YaiI (UPF0178 family)
VPFFICPIVNNLETPMALSVSDIETAIESIQTNGQTVSVDGMSYSAANISQLYAMLEKERAKSDRSDGNRPTFRAFKFNGMGY